MDRTKPLSLPSSPLHSPPKYALNRRLSRLLQSPNGGDEKGITKIGFRSSESSVPPSARLRIALNLVELERRLPFSHQTRSEQYLADKTILGRNKSQIASSSFSLSSNKGERGRGRPPFLLCRQNPLLLNRELVRGQETSPLRPMVGGRERVSESPAHRFYWPTQSTNIMKPQRRGQKRILILP